MFEWINSIAKLLTDFFIILISHIKHEHIIFELPVSHHRTFAYFCFIYLFIFFLWMNLSRDSNLSVSRKVSKQCEEKNVQIFDLNEPWVGPLPEPHRYRGEFCFEHHFVQMFLFYFWELVTQCRLLIIIFYEQWWQESRYGMDLIERHWFNQMSYIFFSSNVSFIAFICLLK